MTECISEEIVDYILTLKKWTITPYDEISNGISFKEVPLYSRNHGNSKEKFFSLLVFLQVVVLWKASDGSYYYAINKNHLINLEKRIRYYSPHTFRSKDTAYSEWFKQPYLLLELESNYIYPLGGYSTSSFELFNLCEEHELYFLQYSGSSLWYCSCYIEGEVFLKENKFINKTT